MSLLVNNLNLSKSDEYVISSAIDPLLSRLPPVSKCHSHSLFSSPSTCSPLIVLSAFNYLTQSPCPINLLSFTFTLICFYMTAETHLDERDLCPLTEASRHFKCPQLSFDSFSFELLSLLINAESPPHCVLVNTVKVKQTFSVSQPWWP